MAKIAWIGLGNMGSRMCLHLKDAGHDVSGYDLNEDLVDRLATEGIVPTRNIPECVKEAEVVFTMLPKGEHVHSVLSSTDGVWNNAPSGALLVDSSTIDVETSRKLHEESAARGFAFLDAPVSGGVSGAAAGTLAFMLGGRPENIEKARQYIEPMSGNIFVAGGPGLGLAAKIANNMMLFIDMLANSEGSQLAKALGLDPKTFWEIASASSGRSWAQQTWYPVPGVVESSAANNNFSATFSTDLARKDVELALQAGDKAGLNLSAAALAAKQFDSLIEEGYGGKDCSLIVKYVSTDGKIDGWTESD